MKQLWYGFLYAASLTIMWALLDAGWDHFFGPTTHSYYLGVFFGAWTGAWTAGIGRWWRVTR